MNNVYRGLQLVALGLGVGLSAWVAGCKARDVPSPVVDEGVCLLEGELSPQCDQLCLETRRVARSPGSCSPAAPAPANWGTETRGGYCTYEWQGAGAPDPTDYPSGTVPECIVTPTETPAELVAYLVARRTHAKQYGTIVAPNDGSSNPVMVAVVDTAPRQLGKEKPSSITGAAEHGLAMASIVRDIACGEGTASPCPRTVETFLGLPRKLGQASAAKDGGYYGLQSDLAEGILDALEAYDEWKQEDANQRGKLVINLSVGWEPMCDHGGSEPVRDAIEQAHERGALVLVAAGNRRPGTCVEGPTAPGSWGAEAREASPEPLVHAITPVDEGLANLVTFRPGSNTRIATRAFMIVTTDESVDPSRTLGPYSGSSVATAVTSGIAALAWSHEPGLTADALMDALWTSGQPRGDVVADSYFQDGQGAPAQHVISACRALDYVRCPQGGCVPSGCEGPSGDAVQEVALACADSQQVPVIITEPAQTATFECPTCSGPVTTVAYGAEWIPEPPHPWVVPQPDDPPCPICPLSLVPNGTAYATLLRNSVYDSYTVVSTTITVTNSTGSEHHTYGVSELPLEDDISYRVENEGFELVNGYPPTGASVAVTFAGDPQFTVSNTITVN